MCVNRPQALTVCDKASENAGVLAFCGHTHGGLVGLLSLGSNATLMSVIGLLDHGLWGVRRTRGYVHRAQGFRALACNWVVRLGVPAEHSVLEIEWKPLPRSSDAFSSDINAPAADGGKPGCSGARA